MNERVIITLKYGKQEADFDLPGKTKIKDFKEDLKQLLMKNSPIFLFVTVLMF